MLQKNLNDQDVKYVHTDSNIIAQKVEEDVEELCTRLSECHIDEGRPKRNKGSNGGKRKVITMAGDGNCLFRALSHQLHGDYGERHSDVRKEICDYLEAHKDEFSMALLLNDEDKDVCNFEKYVKEMRTNRVWGGNVEIACAARLYR